MTTKLEFKIEKIKVTPKRRKLSKKWKNAKVVVFDVYTPPDQEVIDEVTKILIEEINETKCR